MITPAYLHVGVQSGDGVIVDSSVVARLSPCLVLWLLAGSLAGCEKKPAAGEKPAPGQSEGTAPSAQGGAPGACQPGFETKGSQCVDIDECSFVASVCGTPQATCANKPGGYECTCPRGYAGGGSLGIACTPRVVSGVTATCVLPESGGVVCLGAKDGGVWSQEYPDEMSATSTPIVLTEDAVGLSLGISHNCILRKDSTVACWGANDQDQLGNGKEGRRTVPHPIPGLQGVVQIAAGGNNTCAVLRDQSMRCWGGNKSGELTAAFPAKTNTPKTLDVGKVASILLGMSHACALLTNGKVMCWGENYYGQLGNGTSAPPGHPKPPAELPGLAGVRAIIENAALLADGSVMIWGEDHTNLKMTLDEVDGIINRIPTRVPEFQNIIAIGGEMNAICALSADGKLRCRGIGPLGDGKRRNSAAPVEIQAGTQLLAVAPTGNCVLDAQQGAVCWGLNKSQRFGGKAPWVLSPTAVAGLAVFAANQPKL